MFTFFHCSWFLVFRQFPTVQLHIHTHILFLLLSSIMVSPKKWDIVPFSCSKWPQFCFSPSRGIIDLLSNQQALPECQQSREVLGTQMWGDTKSLCRCLRMMITYSWSSMFPCHLTPVFTDTCPLSPCPQGRPSNIPTSLVPFFL